VECSSGGEANWRGEQGKLAWREQAKLASKANWRGESKANSSREQGKLASIIAWRASQTQVQYCSTQLHRNLLSAFKNCVLASCVGQNTVFSRTGGEEWDENTTPQRKALIAQARCCGGGRAETTRQAKNAMSFSPLELEG